MTLGQRLKAYREKEGLTQEQLAEYLNVSRQAVTKWEHDAGMPDIENLIAISRRMGATLDELVLGSEPEKSVPFVSPSAPPTAKHSTPSELARYHAFAALAFAFAAFCQVVAGCVNLAAAFHRSVPAYLPILNFCSVMLLLYVAYVQAVKCSQYRQKSTCDPYDKK